MTLEDLIAENTHAVADLNYGLKMSIDNMTHELRGLIKLLSTQTPATQTVAVDSVAPQKAATEVKQKEVVAAYVEKMKTAEIEPVTAPVVEATLEDVKKAITAYATANGRDATIALLKVFNVSRAGELTPDQYAGVLNACIDTEGVSV